MLSIIIAARNDDYGGDFLRRLQIFVNINLPAMAKYAPESELVITEWNPPESKPLLKDALKWPTVAKSLPVRIVEVPREIHECLPNSKEMPMFEFIAKNVGLRRSSGSHMLVTNPDIIFSTELILEMGATGFSEKCFYRVDRYDYSGALPATVGRLRALSTAKLRIHSVHVAQRKQTQRIKVPVTGFQKLRGLVTGSWPGSHDLYVFAPRTKNLLHAEDGVGPYWGLHTNGSGDFLLTHRSNWHRIQGFAEFTDTFTHIDSYACYQLKAAGIKQRIFTPPRMIMHQDHLRNNAARPRKDPETWLEDIEAIRKGVLGPAFNGPNWGLGDLDLKESRVYV